MYQRFQQQKKYNRLRDSYSTPLTIEDWLEFARSLCEDVAVVIIFLLFLCLQKKKKCKPVKKHAGKNLLISNVSGCYIRHRA